MPLTTKEPVKFPQTLLLWWKQRGYLWCVEVIPAGRDVAVWKELVGGTVPACTLPVYEKTWKLPDRADPGAEKSYKIRRRESAALLLLLTKLDDFLCVIPLQRMIKTFHQGILNEW